VKELVILICQDVKRSAILQIWNIWIFSNAINLVFCSRHVIRMFSMEVLMYYIEKYKYKSFVPLVMLQSHQLTMCIVRLTRAEWRASKWTGQYECKPRGALYGILNSWILILSPIMQNVSRFKVDECRLYDVHA
jgi:hypothetical protein